MKINSLEKKIISIENYNNKNYNNKKIVFTNGCFDIIHRGHLKLLHEAKKLGDMLIVGLNSDKSIKLIKGNSRPIMNNKNRSYLLASISFVDLIIFFNEPTPLKLITTIKPDILVKGGEYNKKDIIGYDFMKKNNKKICLVSMEKNYSSSNIIKYINTI